MGNTMLQNRLKNTEQADQNRETDNKTFSEYRQKNSFVRAAEKAGHQAQHIADEFVQAQQSDEEFEQSLLSEEDKLELKKLRTKKKHKFLRKVVQVALSAACVYLVFLIYGALKTEYAYDDRGRVVPVVMTVDQIKETTEYTSMTTYYLQARTLYEKVLMLDYRLGTGLEEPLLIAPEYEKIMNDISSLSVQIGAINISAQYTQLVSMLLSWVQNDIALYCQFISRAITKNSVGDMNQALTYKETMYTNFQQITMVIATLGSRIENIDVTDIAGWSPEGYVQKQIGGV